MKLQSPIKRDKPNPLVENITLEQLMAAPTTPATQNPRKATTGTSYDAKGLVPNPSASELEQGSSIPTRILDVVPELVSPFQRQQIFAKMKNDASVDVSMRAGKTPVIGADYYVESYSADPVDMEIADFIWGNLFEGMSAPFCNSIEDIVRMYEDGYAVLEKVNEIREWTPKRKGGNTKNYTMLKKLGVRPVNTIKEITYDNNGGPTSVVQNAIQADGSINEVTLDIANVLIFTFGRIGGDLTGKSLLRTAYPHWFYKTHMYKVDAIQKERHSLGIPKGRLLPGWKEADKIALRQLLRNLRTNEESFMLLTPLAEVDFAEIKGQLVNVLESANHHNVMILMNVMAQFLALGVEHGGGGRATSGSQVDMFMKAFRYVANAICDVINMYVIPELVVWNYPTKNFPKLKVRNIGEVRDIQMLAAALANLFAQGAITADEETEDWIRTTFDMPRKTAPYTTPTKTTQTTPPVGGSQNGAPQKGNVGNNGGQGNVGKPPNAVS